MWWWGKGVNRALLYKINEFMLSRLFGLFVIRNALFFIKLIWHLGYNFGSAATKILTKIAESENALFWMVFGRFL